MKTVDLTPTWAALMPAFLAMIENGTGEGRAVAVDELTRLARSADAANLAARSVDVEPVAAPLAQVRRDLAGEVARFGVSSEGSAIYAQTDSGVAFDLGRASAFFWAAATVAGSDTPNGAAWQERAESNYRGATAARNRATDQTNLLARSVESVWVVRGVVTDSDAHKGAALGADEWQFSDGPPGQRGTSTDFADLCEGLRAFSGSVMFWDSENDAGENSPDARTSRTFSPEVAADALALWRSPHYGNESDALAHAADGFELIADELARVQSVNATKGN